MAATSGPTCTPWAWCSTGASLAGCPTKTPTRPAFSTGSRETYRWTASQAHLPCCTTWCVPASPAIPASHNAAEAALRTFLEGEAGGFNTDPNQTVADYLHTWLTAKSLVLKPTTMARYGDYVHNDLAPAFGSLRLDELRHRHIAAFVTGQLAAGRGRTTLYRCLATLSSALGDAVRQHRLAHTPPAHRPCADRPRRNARIRTTDEAVRFLKHCHQAAPDLAELFEFLIGTGLLKGEALGLHWDDVHLREGVL
ncbi:tyrosine recombinase XerC [Streptomyces sp. NPDC093591]|uniref:site-specific integrase n=1 Tax=Streptomyces sp. NPDC093591 TaxID=3366044 RepID=UPI00381F475A